MANLGNTIINGILRVNGKLNVGGSITASSFIGDLVGNAATATTATEANHLTTARTISLTGDATASGSFNGSANLSLSTAVNKVSSIDDRDIKPSATNKHKVTFYFASKAGLTGTGTTSPYVDLMVLNGYTDSTGGQVNALAFDKSSKTIYHYQAAQDATTWGTASQIAYITSNVASATKLQTARTINGVAFDGSKNITIEDDTKLPLAGGTVTGETYFNQGTSVKTINGGAGQTGYFKVCTFTITNNYQNQCMKLHITQRNRFGNLYIIFSSSNSTNPSISAFYKDGSGIVARLVKSEDGVFDLYVQKQESYDNLEVTILEKGSYMAGTKITWGNTTVSSLPSTTDFPTYKDATWLSVSGNAATATKLQTARTINGVAFDGSKNITIEDDTKLPLAGGTVTGELEVANDNPSIIIKNENCQYFKYQLTETENGDFVLNKITPTGSVLGVMTINTIGDIEMTSGGNGTFSSVTATGGFNGDLNGNAHTASELATARTIGVSGVTGTAQSFDGSRNIVIPITAVPANLLTGKTAIKGSEITNDKHWIPSSDNTVTNIRQGTLADIDMSSSTSSDLIVISDLGYISTQETSLTCELPLDL